MITGSSVMRMIPTQQHGLHQVTLGDCCAVASSSRLITRTRWLFSTQTGYLSLQIYLPNVCVRAALSIINMYDKMGGMLKCVTQYQNLREWNLLNWFIICSCRPCSYANCQEAHLENFKWKTIASVCVIYHKSQCGPAVPLFRLPVSLHLIMWV